MLNTQSIRSRSGFYAPPRATVDIDGAPENVPRFAPDRGSHRTRDDPRCVARPVTTTTAPSAGSVANAVPRWRGVRGVWRVERGERQMSIGFCDIGGGTLRASSMTETSATSTAGLH